MSTKSSGEVVDLLERSVDSAKSARGETALKTARKRAAKKTAARHAS
jgi:hypothetical protein